LINAWLAFLDGAQGRKNIICIGATNYSDRVDPSMLRPGRLVRHIKIPIPRIDDLPGMVRH
jgi:ATP-dependent 26S proteasome regulatory subunit